MCTAMQGAASPVAASHSHSKRKDLSPSLGLQLVTSAP